MKIMRTKDFDKSLAKLKSFGGRATKAANEVYAVIGRYNVQSQNPFDGLKLTHYGETRIDKCLKYDLEDSYRLITVQEGGYAFLLYVGGHDNCDKWLNSPKNKRLKIKVGLSGEPILTSESIDINDPTTRIETSFGFSNKELLTFLDEVSVDRLLDGVPRNICKKLESITVATSDEEIISIVSLINNERLSNSLYDILLFLREDNHTEAEYAVKSYFGELVDVEQADVPLIDGQNIQYIPADSNDYFKIIDHFSKISDYREWMLFMHPEQEKFVDEDYTGPVKLTGVSGSGKTCILVKRACALAKKYPEERILILTLNRSLANLIKDLVEKAALEEVRPRIDVMPFFSLCQKLLHDFEPENDKLYDDRTWKSCEHIDEIWREYYRCELNNYDARVLQRIHDSLIGRNIDAENYIREELDWIRSAIATTNREQYLQAERSGRSYAFDKSFRQDILKGLHYWERKMRAIGVTDYLGISTALYRYLDKLMPIYRCILVDESQDFGTTEMQIIRKLVVENSNDIFLCGDAAQQVSSKHQNLKQSGIDIPSARSKKLSLNYRNSRDVLKAAYHVLLENLSEEMISGRDFDILDPSYANFNGPTPLIMSESSIQKEIACALTFLKQQLEYEKNKGIKACLVICGYTLHELSSFAAKLKIPLLDGNRNLDEDSLFISDLENIKGFEFHTVCIVNCSKNILPYIGSPEKERFRDLSRLYVAMTRAQKQLVLSYHNDKSFFLINTGSYFLEGEWNEYLLKDYPKIDYGCPDHLESIRKENSISVSKMSGEQFLYTEIAIGLNPLLIEKIRSLITGHNKSMRSSNKLTPVEWKTIADAAQDTWFEVGSRRVFGPEGYKLFRELVGRLRI